MSERATWANARAKGRRAYLSGIPLEANPMRSPVSRRLWEEAWESERMEEERRRAAQAVLGGEHRTCPFCGGCGCLESTQFGRPVMYWVACGGCGASAGAYSSRESAWAAWDHGSAV